LANVEAGHWVDAPKTARCTDRKKGDCVVAVEALPIGVVKKVKELTNQFDFEPLVFCDGVEDFLD